MESTLEIYRRSNSSLENSKARRAARQSARIQKAGNIHDWMVLAGILVIAGLIVAAQISSVWSSNTDARSQSIGIKPVAYTQPQPSTRKQRVKAPRAKSPITSSRSAEGTILQVPDVPYRDLIIKAAQQAAIDPVLLASLVEQESGFDANATSSVGAGGLTQMMPATAKFMGVENVYDPEQALNGGARYLARQLEKFQGNVAMALAAYNAGPGAVQKYNGVPPYPETQNYVRSILAIYARNRNS